MTVAGLQLALALTATILAEVESSDTARARREEQQELLKREAQSKFFGEIPRVGVAGEAAEAAKAELLARRKANFERQRKQRK